MAFKTMFAICLARNRGMALLTWTYLLRSALEEVKVVREGLKAHRLAQGDAAALQWMGWKK
jgi:hypothetical protein